MIGISRQNLPEMAQICHIVDDRLQCAKNDRSVNNNLKFSFSIRSEV